MPTPDEQTNSDPAKRVLESSQVVKSPAISQHFLDSKRSMDLPTYVSLSVDPSDISSAQSLIPAEDSAEVQNLKKPAENLSRDKEHGPSSRGEVVPSNLTYYANSSDVSPAHHIPENTIQLYDATNHISVKENESESDTAMPLNHSMDDESEDVPLITLPAHPAVPLFPGDLRKDITHRGGLVTSKIMKRSSSVISDSGIESEPSSVVWPLEAALRGRPPLDFSSEREIPQQIVHHRPVHRSSLEGLQMESNGSLPSGGIQASLTSISSLPYEEDQQQRQLSKLTKSVSAPQISSPEDTEGDHKLLNQETDPCQMNCSSLNCNLDPESEFSLLDTSSTADLGHIFKEKSSPSQNLSESYKIKPVLNGVSEVLLLQESPQVKESALIGSQVENINHQTHISGVSASVEDVHFVEVEAAPCSKPCVHKSATDEESINTVEERQSFHQTPLKASNGLFVQRPGELTGLTTNNDAALSTESSRISTSEKKPLDCQTKPSKIPNSGLAFVNKKMVEVVNMSVSCAPTCLPFSSVLRDSPSISGMSTRQATSPITHQPLGSFGIISSSSLTPLNMDDATNERMLK